MNFGALVPGHRAMPALLLLFLLAWRPVALAGELRVVGSDLLGPEFATVLSDYARRNGIVLKLELEGSHAGLSQVKSGQAEIALLVLLPGESPPAAPWHSVALAYHAAVVLVAADMPLPQLTFSQLAGIFGANSSANYTRWGDLGLGGEWFTRNITPQALAPGVALPTELFRHLVLRGGPLKATVVQQDSMPALIKKMAVDQGGIALAATLPAGAKGLKTVPVAKGSRDTAFGPTPQNLHAGDYPLRLPLWLVVRRDAIAADFAFLRFLLDDEVAAALERAQLVPVPRPARSQLSFELEQLLR
jgi:phosphate transport system substrate-binding protein